MLKTKRLLVKMAVVDQLGSMILWYFRLFIHILIRTQNISRRLLYTFYLHCKNNIGKMCMKSRRQNMRPITQSILNCYEQIRKQILGKLDMVIYVWMEKNMHIYRKNTWPDTVHLYATRQWWRKEETCHTMCSGGKHK
jgi:hypothetical protein